MPINCFYDMETVTRFPPGNLLSLLIDIYDIKVVFYHSNRNVEWMVSVFLDIVILYQVTDTLPLYFIVDKYNI